MFFDDFVDEEDDMDHDDTCIHCEAVVTTFKILSGLLNKMQPHISLLLYNQLQYKLWKSEHHINYFKGYVMRTMITRMAWNSLKAQCLENAAFMTFDFPMVVNDLVSLPLLVNIKLLFIL